MSFLKFFKKTYPLFMDGVQRSQGYRATTRRQFFFTTTIEEQSINFDNWF